ncbi:hypothetical protein [Pseudokineococcus sp. 1T1Z-3]|uniref:hypothetical protein n=1 Tax=Pseudokineococcus sp. 1T1Z-3 TaxID=3132745 RepID=UPI0030B77ED8
MGTARAAFAVGVVAVVGVLVWSAAVLPEQVPRLFDADGSATAYASRGVWLAGMAGTAAVVVAVLLGAVPAVRRWPRLANVPNAGVWRRPEHREQLVRLLTEDMLLLAGAALLLLAGVCALSASAAQQAEPTIGPWGWLLSAVFAAVVVARVVWMLTRRYAVPEDARR